MKFGFRSQRKRPLEPVSRYASIYGGFDQEDYSQFAVTGLPNESKFYWGELIKWASNLKPTCALLAGENKPSALMLREYINAETVLTAGLSDDADYYWDFDEAPPEISENIDLVISQAILEHLLNPFQHLKDLTSLLLPGGHILIHTHPPGFAYHRYPIDALRFFPDWFECSADKLGLRVERRRIVDDPSIFYMYRKL